MPLRENGIDIFYIDESLHGEHFIATAVCVPFLRIENGHLIDEWLPMLRAAETWRRNLSANKNIRFRKELHGFEFLGSKGLYKKGNLNLYPDEAHEAYHEALSTLSFLGPSSIITVHASQNTNLFGAIGLDAALNGLFQRMRMHCNAVGRNAMIFFDHGRPNYIKLFRRAVRYLPTGANGENRPIDMFIKDGNVKDSGSSYFIQIADLVAYAALAKVRFSDGTLNAKRIRRQHHELYDSIPIDIINTRATRLREDGIVFL